MCNGGRGPNRVQYALKENEKGYEGCLKEYTMGTRRSGEVKESLNDRQTPPIRGLCEGRENRGSVSIEEAPDSVRGVTGVQYPSRTSRKVIGCG